MLKAFKWLCIEIFLQFLRLFEEYGGCPWIWGLHEWSNWLTPTHFGKMKSRFDTAFYITFMDKIPILKTDDHEAEVIEVSSI